MVELQLAKRRLIAAVSDGQDGGAASTGDLLELIQGGGPGASDPSDR